MALIDRKIVVAAALLVAASHPAHGQQMVVLNTTWDLIPYGSDHMTTSFASERSSYQNRGATFYASNAGFSGTSIVYRLLDYTGDHMDSLITNEGGYSNEGPLYGVWPSSSSARGLTAVQRINSTTDHATVRAGDSISGYSNDAILGYAYPRYYNVSEDLVSLTAGGVTISSNKVAGGAIWSWVWNGTEFIDHSDYGTLFQTAADWFENGTLHNPTEAGSAATPSTGQLWERQGSPIYSASNSSSTQSTRAIPLEWDPRLWGGDLEAHPVIYPDMLIGKDITLNWNNMGAVARYSAVVTYGTSKSNVDLEAPTAYLPTSFNRYYTYDASSEVLTEVFPSNNCSSINWAPTSGHGGVIISNSAQDKAMGVGGKTLAASGQFGYFALFDCSVGTNPTSKWSAYVPQATRAVGTETYNSFVTTGTLAGVKANLRALYLSGDF